MSALNNVSEADRETLTRLGWHQDGDNFVGDYDAGAGLCSGVVRPEHGQWNFYILDCPEQVLRGSKSACLRPRPKYQDQTQHWVHFHSPPPGVVAGIIAISEFVQADFANANPADEQE